jgi:hypothetical protein
MDGNAGPFGGLPAEQDGSFLLYEQSKVPLRTRDSHQIIHDTSTVDYLLKTMAFKTQKKFKLTDFQFALSARVKKDNLDAQMLAEERRKAAQVQREVDAGVRKGKKKKSNDGIEEADHDHADLPPQLEKPLIEDCLAGIENSILKVLEKLKDYFNNINHNQMVRERCTISVIHQNLETAIRVGNFELQKENLAVIADLVTTGIYNFINSGSYIRLNVPLNESFQVRFVVSLSCCIACIASQSFLF